MQLALWFRVLILSVAFVAVVYGILDLRRGGSSHTLIQTLGFSNSSEVENREFAQLSWCHLRPVHLRIPEVGSLSTDSKPAQAWLHENCNLQVIPVVSEISGHPILTIEFADGSSEEIYQNGDYYQFRGIDFRSPQLKKAIFDLTALLTNPKSEH